MEEVVLNIMDLSIIIITWNQIDLLRQCVASVAGNSHRYNTEIILVDNGSTDDTDKYLEDMPVDRIIRNSRNMGVSKARNQGINASTGRYILHLDDDTVIHEGCIDRLVSFMDRYPGIWLSGGKLLNPDGSLQFSARTFYDLPTILARRSLWGRTQSGRKLIGNHLMQSWNHQDSRTVDWICGACFCMRKEAVDEIGKLDDGYFFGIEDVDWAFRVWSAGGMVAYVHDAVTTHHYQRSSARLFSRKAICHLASLVRFHIKHGFKYPARPQIHGDPIIFE